MDHRFCQRGKKLTKKTNWSQFEGIVPKSEKLVMYPLMENTKLQKDRNTIKLQDLQIDEDDIPLSPLMRKRPRKDVIEKIRREISPKDVMENNLIEKKILEEQHTGMENNQTKNTVSKKKTNVYEDDNPLIEIKKRKLTETKTNKTGDAVKENNSSRMKNPEKRKMASKEWYTVMTSGVENDMTKNPVSNNTSSDKDDIPFLKHKPTRRPMLLRNIIHQVS